VGLHMRPPKGMDVYTYRQKVAEVTEDSYAKMTNGQLAYRLAMVAESGWMDTPKWRQEAILNEAVRRLRMGGM
jgi:hypothetical protein